MNTEELTVSILVVEDDPDDQILIEEALKQNQLSGGLRFVGDGEECMDYLYNRGKYADKRNSPRPDLILLDLNLPRKDGREVLVEIKANPVLKGIPVIILSTSTDSEDILRSYGSGAASYIKKPDSFDSLLKAFSAVRDYWFGSVTLPSREK
jgi:CheY-like chemotaxis protein